MKILMTQGIGDLIAVESLLTPRERYAVDEIVWVSKHHEDLSQLSPVAFPNLYREHVVIEPGVTEGRVDKRVNIQAIQALTDYDLSGCLDYAWHVVNAQLLAGQRHYQGSLIAMSQLADVSHLRLPDRYCAIHPYSTHSPRLPRNFTRHDWLNVLEWLDQKQLPAVVLGLGEKKPPQHPLIHNRINGTTLLEAMAVVQNCHAFLGCASCLSVMAARVLPRPRLGIVTHTSLLRDDQRIYYLPHEDRSFLVTAIVHRLPCMEV